MKAPGAYIIKAIQKAVFDRLNIEIDFKSI
jgi:hypothetical protein